jgi:hypothetical protein
MIPTPLNPEDQAVEGPAFPWLIKGMASVLMVALVLSGWAVLGKLTQSSWFTALNFFVASTMALIIYCYYWILRSHTSIDANHIRQSWLWSKQVKINAITQAKFIYVPYLHWLIAPRLIVRIGGRGSYVFHAADARVQAAFARLSLGYKPLSDQ